MSTGQAAAESPDFPEVVLISIRSRFVRLILSGVKTFELRKRIPRAAVGRSVVVYSSGEDKAITACGTVASVTSGTPESIWKLHSDKLGISHEEFTEYFCDSNVGYALELKDVTPSRRTLTLSELRAEHGLEPPQSWRYLSRQAYSDLLEVL